MNEFDKATHFTISIFFFVTVAILAALYVYWFRVSPPDSAPIGPATLDYELGVIVVVIYAFLALMLALTKKHLLFIPTALLFCISAAYTVHSMPSLVSTAECHGTTYDITYHESSFGSDWAYYQLTKWTGPLEYNSTFFRLASAGAYPNRIICSQKTNEVWFFSYDTDLTYYDGTRSYYYEWSWGTSVNDIHYEILYYDVNQSRNYVLTVCRTETPETCQIIPVGHASPVADDEKGSLIVDRNTRDVYILFDGQLDSAYGDPTRKFETLGSVITEADSTRAQYSIAAYPHDNAYVYVLYGCDVTNNYDPFTECHDLPFSYSTPGRETAGLAIDPAAGQLSVTVGGRLVFTYKGVYADPYCDSGCLETHCYLDRCIIPPPLP